MVALLLAAVAVGLGNLAASIGIGVTGVTTRMRIQVGVVFGAFEAGMPVVGLLVGQRLANHLGDAVRWPGAILLMIVGAQGLVRSIRDGRKNAAAPTREPSGSEAPSPSAVDPGPADPGLADPGLAALGELPPGAATPGSATPGVAPPRAARPSLRVGRLLISGLVLSVDNLVVGFALGTYGVGIAFGAILIGAVSVAMSLVGLELGGLLGRWAGQRSEQMSGVILILVGAAIAGGALT